MEDTLIAFGLVVLINIAIGLSLRHWFPELRNNQVVWAASLFLDLIIVGWVLHNELIYYGVAGLIGAILAYELINAIGKVLAKKRVK